MAATEDKPEEDPRKGVPPHLKVHLDALGPELVRAGIALPEGWEDTRAVPQIYVKERVSVMARKMAENFGGNAVYRVDQEVVRINREQARMEVIKPTKFVSFLEDYMAVVDFKHGETKLVSLSRHRAEEVMRSDHFLAKLPVLEGINPVKLPVRRADGKLRLLPQGYDAESRVFTLEGGVDYEEDWPIDRARDYLRKLLQYFSWGNDQGFTNHLAAMLTVYCRDMLPAGARPPIFIYNANLVGSGKTRLVQMCLVPVYGPAETTTWMPNEDEFKKTLDSYAQAAAPYLFLDDNEGFLKSKLINQWATGSVWAGRVLGSKDKFVMPLKAITFITGNSITLSSDLERRRVAVELLAREDANERKLPSEVPRITEEWLAAEQNRGAILSALYAHVRHAEQLREDHESFATVQGGLQEPFTSFEGWSGVVPFICAAAGHGDPLVRLSTAEDGISGDPDVPEARKLAKAVLDELVGDQVVATIPLRSIIPLARRHECFLGILGDIDGTVRDIERMRGGFKEVEVEEVRLDSLGNEAVYVVRRQPTLEDKRKIAAEWSDRKMETSFGIRFKRKVLSLHIRASNGRLYEFGNVRNKRTSVLTITEVKTG